MHTIRIKPIEGNLSNHVYSVAATKGNTLKSSGREIESSGSRRAYAEFFGLDPQQLSKSSYAKCKESLTASFPQKVKTSAFNHDKQMEIKNSLLDTNINPDSRTFKKAEKAFYLLPSSHASSVHPNRPLSNQSSLNQQDHLKEIVGQIDKFEKEREIFYAGSTPKPDALGPRQFENLKYNDPEVKGQRK